MKPDRWLRLEELFDAAVELPAEERRLLLDRECASDSTLRGQVESLIISSDVGDEFIQAAVHGAARQLADFEPRPDEIQRIGPYRVIRELGPGGMGAVFLAARADDEYRKEVAIKLVRGAFATSEMLRRFRSERQILANLDHPNIARLLDGGTTESGAPYVVMEYVEGESIDEYSDRNRLPTEARLELFRKVCSAIQYAHQNLVVHRDIKPGNILVTSDGEPKLLDFGIAKLLNPHASPQTVAETRADMRLMTPEYASPEQVRGGQIGTASDVYSLGVVLYELLTGHRPQKLNSLSPQEVEDVVCVRQPEKPSTAVTRDEGRETDGGPVEAVTGDVRSERRSTTIDKLKRRLRGDLDNIILMAMRKEPERRYSSVDQLSEDIRRHLEGLPVAARPATLGYRTRKFLRRHRTAVAAVAAAFALVAVLVGFYTYKLASERDRAQLEASKAKQVSDFLISVFEVSDPEYSKGETVTAKELLDRGAARIETELSGQPLVQATMMDTMGRVYRSLGLYKPAEKLLEDSIRVSRQAMGADDRQLAQSLFDRAELLHYENKYDEAEPLYRESLAIRRREFGEDNLDVAKTLDLLGRLVRDKTNYEEAERLHMQAMEIRRKVAGENSSDFADSLHSLAMLARLGGDSKAAETYCRRELAILQKLGKEYPALLFNLGGVLASRGEYQEAISFNRDALALTRKLYGEKHPFVANALEGLALSLNSAGDFAAAEPLIRQSIKMRRELFGENSIEFALSMDNLARVLTAKGDYKEAEPLYRRALTTFTKLLGAEHPRVADTKNNLGILLYDKGDLAAAEQICREALALDLKQLGSDHPYVAVDKYNLARIVRARGDDRMAETLFKEALDLQKRKLDEGHPSTIATMLGLGGLLTDDGDPASAEPLLREAVTARKKTYPDGDWQIAEAEGELGHCLAALDRFDDAEPLLLRSYRTLIETRGERTIETRRSLDNVIDLYKRWGRPHQAAAYIASKAKYGG
jgi:eukaryotic-like serine/threonine-protein kinase